MHHVDWLTTFLALALDGGAAAAAEIAATDGLDGVNQWPALAGEVCARPTVFVVVSLVPFVAPAASRACVGRSCYTTGGQAA